MYVCVLLAVVCCPTFSIPSFTLYSVFSIFIMYCLSVSMCALLARSLAYVCICFRSAFVYDDDREMIYRTRHMCASLCMYWCVYIKIGIYTFYVFERVK